MTIKTLLSQIRVLRFWNNHVADFETIMKMIYLAMNEIHERQGR